MLRFQKALQALKIRNTTAPTPQEVESAYRKMLLRYPANLFPEKFRDIHMAFEVLTYSDLYWQKPLEEDQDHLSFFLAHMDSSAPNSSPPQAQEKHEIKITQESDGQILRASLSAFLKATL